VPQKGGSAAIEPIATAVTQNNTSRMNYFRVIDIPPVDSISTHVTTDKEEWTEGTIQSLGIARAQLVLESSVRIEIVARSLGGAMEAAWTENGEDHHEINLLFEISIHDLNPNVPPASKESHLEFVWASPDELEEHNLLPAPLVDCLTNWRSDGCFWGSALCSTK